MSVLFQFAILTFILLTTIQKHLVSTETLTNARQSVNNPLAQPFSLNILIHGNILNMTCLVAPSNELVLHEQRPDGTDPIVGFRKDDNGVVCLWKGFQPVELRCPCGFTYV